MVTESMQKDNLNPSQNEEKSFAETMHDFWKSFKKFWWISAISCVILSLASYIFFSVTFVPKYKTGIRFTITPLVQSDAQNGASVYNFNYNSVLATQMAATFPYIITSGVLSDIVANDLGRPVSVGISAVAIADTNIFEVYVTSTSADDAYDVITSLIKNYPKVAEYVIGDTRMNIISGSEPVRVTRPYNIGENNKYIALCGMLGVLLGVIVAFIDMRVAKTVMTKRDIETYFNGKCICEIPLVKKKRSSNSSSLIHIGASASGFSEAIRVLKQRTRAILKANQSTIVGVTSSVTGEGKTTVAYNLAKSLSGSDYRVLLIDMDLHSRKLQNTLNQKEGFSDIGITDVIAGKVEFDNAINSVSDTFDILLAGKENGKFRKSKYSTIFEHAREKYDYIIVDMPTCGLVSETVQIADLCDEVAFVIRWNTVSPEQVYNSIKYMAFSDAKIMGFVLNAIDDESIVYKHYGRYSRYDRYSRYGKYGKYGKYGYGYGYGSSYGKNYNYNGSRTNDSANK